MNKKEFIDLIAEKTCNTKKLTGEFVDAVFDTITEQLAAGDEVRLTGFGVFKTNTRAARQAKNPFTGEMMEIPETRMPAFKAASGLKEACR